MPCRSTSLMLARLGCNQRFRSQRCHARISGEQRAAMEGAAAAAGRWRSTPGNFFVPPTPSLRAPRRLRVARASVALPLRPASPAAIIGITSGYFWRGRRRLLASSAPFVSELGPAVTARALAAATCASECIVGGAVILQSARCGTLAPRAPTQGVLARSPPALRPARYALRWQSGTYNIQRATRSVQQTERIADGSR
jgi:hypothetical protein